MLSYLPGVHDLRGVAGLAATLVLLVVLGSAATPRRTLSEIRLVAGGGIVCLVLTAWGVLTAWPLWLPAGGLALAGLMYLAWLSPAARARGCGGRILVLTLPLWLLLLSARPSQIDTWLNLLPNAAYLFDHNVLPTAHGAASYSFLPLAPYNTQFVAYLASLASGAFADGAMGWFNTALLCGAGLLLARAVAGTEDTPPWWACAAGLLLVAPLNPGFVPRFFLSPYGEPALAVTMLFAVWLASELLGDLAAGVVWPRSTVPLALVLAALVNIKQSGIGSLAAIGIGAACLIVTDPAIPRRRALGVVVAAFGPALLLYLLWRGFVLSNGLADAELKPLPFAEWHWALLPQIILAMLAAIFRAAAFFMCVATVLMFAIRSASRLLRLVACVLVLFNGFLLLTYVAHFPVVMAENAHSFFRYNTQVSLLVMLGLVVALRPWVTQRLTHLRGIQHAAVAVIVLILVLPIATAGQLRFDRDTPQPELWRLGHAAAAYVRPGDRLALILPNDTDDSVGSMLRGVLLFTPPRRPGLDFRIDTSDSPDALNNAAAAGYRLALVTCAAAGVTDVPAGAAAMLQRNDNGWHVLQTWPWPSSLRTQRFAALLARGPLCAGPRP
jgi:hypothetical protein